MTEYDSYDLFMFSELHVCPPYIPEHTQCHVCIDGGMWRWDSVGVGVIFFLEKMRKSEKIWVGVKNFGGKNPKYGKNLVVGVILDQFGKMYHTLPGFFPDPPLSRTEK